MKRVAIIGHGFVGKGMERLFAEAFEVRIYDIKTQTQKQQVRKCDLAILCVPTPEKPDGSADTSAVEEVASWIDAPLVCIKSTVPPGTTDKLNMKFGDGWKFHFSPEYMGEPKNFVPPWRYPDPRDARSHSFVTVGGPRASQILDYFATVMGTHARYIQTTAKAAELAKYMENSYFAAKVTFCNEFAHICEAFDVDYKIVRDLWLADSRIDPDHTLVFADAPGFGGKCLPKDTKAIVAAARERGCDADLLKAVLMVNQKMREPAMRMAAE